MPAKKIRIGINGFGRIGSVLLRALLMEKYDLDLVAVNTIGSPDISDFAHQFKYDSVYGRAPFMVNGAEPQKGGEIGRL
ncbi:hypothetical protein COY20_01975, partial [Candidatus Shapirobacteria bacterium CG_4_10_14_0_2_um_filter_40_12]